MAVSPHPLHPSLCFLCYLLLRGLMQNKRHYITSQLNSTDKAELGVMFSMVIAVAH
jgi:hypothetical protein